LIRWLPVSENLKFLMWASKEAEGSVGKVHFYESIGDEWLYVMTDEDMFEADAESDEDTFATIYLSEDSEMGKRFLIWFKDHGGTKADIRKLFGRE